MPSSSFLSVRLHTARMTLRPFAFGDARRVVELVNDRDIAAMTLNIPYPYSQQHAETFITGVELAMMRDDSLVMGMAREGTLIGCVGLRLVKEHQRAELGYWLGKPYWGQNYTSEACRAVLRFAFDTLELNRVHAMCFTHNLGSARVLEKIGMRYEGLLQKHVLKEDTFFDVHHYGILRTNFR